MEYRTVLATNCIELDGMVDMMLEDGWYPQGGVAVFDGNLVQALVRDDDLINELENIRNQIDMANAMVESKDSGKH